MIWERLDKLSGRERGLLTVAAVAILAVLANFLVVQPTMRRLSGLDGEIERKLLIRERNRKMLEEELLVSEEYRAAGALLMRSGNSSEEIENLKEMLGNLAGRTGVALDSINHREPFKTKQCEEYAIEISRFQAGMPGLLRFLHELSAAEGLLRVSRLSIKPKQKSDLVEGALTISKVALVE